MWFITWNIVDICLIDYYARTPISIQVRQLPLGPVALFCPLQKSEYHADFTLLDTRQYSRIIAGHTVRTFPQNLG